MQMRRAGPHINPQGESDRRALPGRTGSGSQQNLVPERCGAWAGLAPLLPRTRAMPPRELSEDEPPPLRSPSPPPRRRSAPPELGIKCVLVGDGAVGKSSLIVSYTCNGYPARYRPTALDTFSGRVAPRRGLGWGCRLASRRGGGRARPPEEAGARPEVALLGPATPASHAVPRLALQCKSWWMEPRCALSCGTRRDR